MQVQDHFGVILYSNIEGFTKRLRQNRQQALKLQQFHRRLLREQAEAFGGSLLQYQADQGIIHFPEVAAAARCAVAVQQIARSSDLPLRMGLCAGDIVQTDTDTFGETVLVAAEIERLGQAGSVLGDSSLREALEQEGYRTRTLGLFNSKHRQEAVEVLTIVRPDLVIPTTLAQPNGTPVSAQIPAEEAPPGIMRTLWRRGVPQLLAGYFAIGWTLLEFVDWLLERYQISAYWTDVLLVIFLAMAPSALLYFYHRERLNRGQWTRIDRMVMSGNLLLTLALVVTLFWGANLGAMTRDVTFVDESGRQRTKTVVKPEFVKRLMLYPLQPPAGAGDEPWQAAAIPQLLTVDLEQNEYIFCNYNDSYLREYTLLPLRERIRLARDNGSAYFLTGAYQQSGDTLRVRVQLYETESGELLRTRDWQNTDIFALTDSIATAVKTDLELTERQIRQFPDLPVSSIMTTSPAALRELILGVTFSNSQTYNRLLRAEELDSTFAFAAFRRAEFLSYANKELAAEPANRALRHSNRLPYTLGVRIKSNCYTILGEFQRAIRFLRNQLEAAPDKQSLLYQLVILHNRLGQYDDMVRTYEQIVQEYPDDEVARSLLGSYYLNANRLDEGVSWIRQEIRNNPGYWRNHLVLAELYEFQKKYDEAAESYQRAIDLQPDSRWEAWMPRWLDHLRFVRQAPPRKEDLQRLTGMYCMEGTGVVDTIKLLHDRLFYQSSTGYGWLAYALEPLKFTQYDGATTLTFFTNKSGEAYKYRLEYMTFSSDYYWRQDSSIWYLEDLIDEGRYPDALRQCREALLRHPEHYYLRNYQQSLEYLLRPATASRLASLNELVGNYTNAANPEDQHLIDEKDGKFYLFTTGTLPLRLLPFDDDAFLIMDRYNLQMRVLRNGGKVSGLRFLRYNHDTEIPDAWDWQGGKAIYLKE